ncbi:hypothetical protein [Legionella longbeachae]|uniref:hypothetical protein n=1 Tax=Legionella longbeachae TaxID=450 RepID=UPI0001BEBC9C|nr:hypothetical protein [Legionella longbeachae]EEZ95958.1 legionella vir region protein LvrA [Legionella longbeachae D-4968]
MMRFIINEEELGALCGLPHIQQLAYFRGIRPYMDLKTGIVGIKRRISYQSIAEQLYIEPHQGIKSQTWSRDQIRRSLSGLVRVGIISVQSEGKHLILKCELATKPYSVQNKAAINPPPKATINPHEINEINTGSSGIRQLKADIADHQKAAIPLNNDNYFIYLKQRFDSFWELYPLKKAQQKAWEVFQTLNPSHELFEEIITALQSQINITNQLRSQCEWVAPWKFPANWLAQHCWKDEILTSIAKESTYATHKTNFSQQKTTDAFWEACKSGYTDEQEHEDNIISFPTQS